MKKESKEGWITGGMTMIGIGVGFVFLHVSALYFVGCTLAGIGLGLFLEVLMDKRK